MTLCTMLLKFTLPPYTCDIALELAAWNQDPGVKTSDQYCLGLASLREASMYPILMGILMAPMRSCCCRSAIKSRVCCMYMLPMPFKGPEGEAT